MELVEPQRCGLAGYPAAMADPTAVLFVCLGNICRSPLAECLLRHKLHIRGLGGTFIVESAGTAAYHVGNPPDPRTQAILLDHGVPVTGSARQVSLQDWERFDHILAMDGSNHRTLEQRRPRGAHAALALALEPVGGGDVPDPYYGGDDGFVRVYDMLDDSLEAWLERWL